MNGTYLVHSVLMAVHSNFLAEVLATVPFHVQRMFILSHFSIDDIKTLCSVMYGSEKSRYYVEANLVKSLGFLQQKSVWHGNIRDREAFKQKIVKYQPCGAGGTRSPPVKSKMADGV